MTKNCSSTLCLIQKWEYENECEVPPLFCNEKSLACFQKPNLAFDFHDPYNNTFGEKKMSIIISVLFFVTLSLMGMSLMIGIVCFERFGLKNQRRLLLDMVSFKFIYSEKATKVCEIFTLLLSYVVTVKSKVNTLQNCVAFSEYMNSETKIRFLFNDQ